MKHVDGFKSEDVYHRLFALLDKRVGKHTLEKLKKDLLTCHIKELERIYSIRLEAESIRK